MEKYKLINQLPFLCVPCCFEMIFDRRGIKVSKTQLELGEMMDFSLDPEVNTSAWKYYADRGITVRKGNWEVRDTGCKFRDFVRQIAEPLGLPLKEKYFTSGMFSRDFDDLTHMLFVEECNKYLKMGNTDIMVALDFNTIQTNGELEHGSDYYAHIVLLEYIDADFNFHIVTPEMSNDVDSRFNGTYRMVIPHEIMFKAFFRHRRGFVSIIF